MLRNDRSYEKIVTINRFKGNIIDSINYMMGFVKQIVVWYR